MLANNRTLSHTQRQQHGDRNASVCSGSRPMTLLLGILWLLPLFLVVPAQAEFGSNPDLYEVNEDANTPWTEIISMEPGVTPDQDDPQGHYVVFPAWALDSAPIPRQEKAILIADYLAEGIDYHQSDELVVLDVVIAAITEPEALAGGQTPDSQTLAAAKNGYSCASWWDHRLQETFTFERSKTLNEDWSASEDRFKGALQGTASFSATLDFDILAQVRISPLYAGCVPYKARLKHAKANGNANVNADISADGSFEQTFEWSKEKIIFDKELFAIDFSIGPLPVHLPISLMLKVGMNTEATIAGTGHAEAHAEASGTISIDCTSSDCNSSSDLNWSHNTPTPTVDVNINAKAQLYAEAVVDIALYHRKVFSAALGARGGAEAQLWGYLGNQCGDGDGDGVNEGVVGLTADFYAFYDVTAKLDSSAFDEKKWTLIDGRYHLGFVDLMNGSSTALTPMISGPSTLDSGDSASYEIRMRPCYPYEDAVSVGWSSNGSDNFGGADNLTPPGAITATGQFQTGSRTLHVSLGGDPYRDLSAYSQSKAITVNLRSATRSGTGEHFGHDLATGDFDCDGIDDLALSVPYEDGNGLPDGGMVQVWFGRSNSLPRNSTAQLLLFADGPESTAGRDNHFGFAVASGDYDADGCEDLTVGMPGRGNDGGAVRVFYGQADGDLQQRMTYINQNHASVPGTRQNGDRFGEDLATGDLNGDGYDDLAIVVPGDGTGTLYYGTTFVLYGSASGIHQDDAPIATREWHQSSTGVPNHRENGDGYAMRVAIGDFDGDSFGDLAIGYPHEDVQINGDGSVIIIRGGQNGLSSNGSYELLQSQAGGSSPEERDYFGAQLAVGDFDGDGYDDLATTAPGEDWGSTVNVGTAHILWGDYVGLGFTNRYFTTDTWAALETDGWFGNSLAVGDVNGDGYDDLVVGATGVDVNGISSAGRLYIAYSDGDRTFTTPADRHGMIDRDTNWIDGAAMHNAGFGSALACGDLDGDGIDDLVAAARWDRVFIHNEAGSASVVKGYFEGLTADSTSHQLKQSN